MLEIKEGEVSEIFKRREGIVEVGLIIDGKEHKAINYSQLTGQIEVGDRVVVNTTATSLQLGTGGYDFIIYILGKERELAGKGHIMKLRYTPYQTKICSVGEEEGLYHKQMDEFVSLEGMPVVVATLHSMLVPIIIMIKRSCPWAKIVYVMTDGAALPLQLSNLLYFLSKDDLIHKTITIGHAFGGDLEAVNIYSGLIAAYLSQADVVVISMGPGIVGTGTKYGFSGVEQANILHAVRILKGESIAIPRISFADSRKSHYGLSHHSRTILGELTLSKVKIGLPYLANNKEEIINRQLSEANIINKHDIIYKNGEGVLRELKELDYKVETMGRDYREDREFFMTAGVGGMIAAEDINRRKIN